MRNKVGRFLILSECGDGVGLALRLKAEGHEAKVKIFNDTFEHQGQGIVDCACEFSHGQTVVADVTGFGQLMDKFRDEGTRTFSGSSFADKLEKDRKFGEEVLHATEVKTPESAQAATWDDAAKLVGDFGEGHEKIVLKPEGALSGVVPSYVASGVEDALSMLKQYEREHSTGDFTLTVQEFIEGVALSTEGWFNGHDWIEGMFNHTLERKQFLNGDHGPSGGCTGNLVWACTPDDPVVKQTLTKLTDVLRKHLYVGPIDVNCVVNKGGVYALEFTPRFGYDAFPTLLYTLCEFDFGDFIDDLARGDGSGESLSPGFGAGVRLSLPPWPSEQFKHEGGVALHGFTEADKQWFYPYGVMLSDEQLQSSHGVGIVGVLNGHGGSVGEAFARAYEVVSRLRVPDLQFRTDLAEVFLEDLRELRSLDSGDEGWIGVDLDGTLALYSTWSDDIGEPVPKMVQRVKRWLAENKEVRILTARGTAGSFNEDMVQLVKIHDWVKEHIGEPLEVTNKKDYKMLKLYDDRVVQIVANEGTRVV
jgi:phosphoribosylamine---glycine ligase